MANSASSIKRARQAVKNNQHNSRIRATVRTFIKKTIYAIENGNKEDASKNFKIMQKTIDKAVSKGIIHKNKAARKKSKINSNIKAL